MLNNLSVVYFSPTGTTRKIVETISKQIDAHTKEIIDITKLDNRKTTEKKIVCDLLIVGFPVYEEHVPDQVIEYLQKIEITAKGALAISVYGNIGFGMSLKEIYSLFQNKGISLNALGAFVGEHSFSDKRVHLAFGRPNEKDLADAQELAKITIKRFYSDEKVEKIKVIGKLPIMAKILPKNSAGMFTKTPVINNKCIKCGVCIKKCPMSAINSDYSINEEKCIRCFACVKSCNFDGRRIEYKKSFLVKNMLKKNNKRMKENMII